MGKRRKGVSKPKKPQMIIREPKSWDCFRCNGRRTMTIRVNARLAKVEIYCSNPSCDYHSNLNAKANNVTREYSLNDEYRTPIRIYHSIRDDYRRNHPNGPATGASAGAAAAGAAANGYVPMSDSESDDDMPLQRTQPVTRARAEPARTSSSRTSSRNNNAYEEEDDDDYVVNSKHQVKDLSAEQEYSDHAPLFSVGDTSDGDYLMAGNLDD